MAASGCGATWAFPCSAAPRSGRGPCREALPSSESRYGPLPAVAEVGAGSSCLSRSGWDWSTDCRCSALALFTSSTYEPKTLPLDTTTVAAEGAEPPRRPFWAEAEESSLELQAHRAAEAASTIHA